MASTYCSTMMKMPITLKLKTNKNIERQKVNSRKTFILTSSVYLKRNQKNIFKKIMLVT